MMFYKFKKRSCKMAKYTNILFNCGEQIHLNNNTVTHLVIHDGAQTHDAHVDIVRGFSKVHLRVRLFHPGPALAGCGGGQGAVPSRLVPTPHTTATAPGAVVVHRALQCLVLNHLPPGDNVRDYIKLKIFSLILFLNNLVKIKPT